MKVDDYIGVVGGGRLPGETTITRHLGERLVAEGRLDAEQVEQAQHRARWLKEPFDRLLIRDGLVAESEVLTLLSDVTGIPVVSMARVELDPHAVESVSVRVIASYHVVPVRLYGGAITLATDSVAELSREEELRVVLGHSIRWVLCQAHEISECVKHYYGVGIEALAGLDATGAAARGGAEGEPRDITAFVDAIIRDAVTSEATDIHFEPAEDGLRLRYRIDGVMVLVPLPHGADQLSRAIVSSIKVMAQLNIAEKRLPQDGRFTFEAGGRDLDIRVSILPAEHGEAANLRILNRESGFLKLDQLGYSPAQLETIEELITSPHGIVLFTGATGSGKTTSLYAGLARINTDERKIITIEDPVEYRMPGVTQLQVNADIDFTFASGLRSVLRHDPDVVLIGEIRDEETARIATSAAMTGHLVFSTLHTNDSASAATRLIEMGVPPYLVASSVEGVIAQQLVRRVCPSCREAVTVDQPIIEQMVRSIGEEVRDATMYRGTGCPDCRFTGYHGRIGLFEMIVMDDALRAMIVERSPSGRLMAQAVSSGVKTLRQCGWQRVLAGETSIDEVLRVTAGPGRHWRG
ncbi:MAG: type II/IV secretion system protein [Verrucomicrobia bacterium]|jgi:type II secretory ATPase GspE/PulE/Tfp pilus assembly ATPase PilB-like protein|nr:type II/IV secretion system protein [Verrucomicrobiota bacterium]MBT7068715.1 type II/IV secretion system protein [Verrucomicrobiota bacterium]MBT7700995.1 type II/IV secretion system protein [Verrucomicrobiota bacterium]